MTGLTNYQDFSAVFNSQLEKKFLPIVQKICPFLCPKTNIHEPPWVPTPSPLLLCYSLPTMCSAIGVRQREGKSGKCAPEQQQPQQSQSHQRSAILQISPAYFLAHFEYLGRVWVMRGVLNSYTTISYVYKTCSICAQQRLSTPIHFVLCRSGFL